MPRDLLVPLKQGTWLVRETPNLWVENSSLKHEQKPKKVEKPC
jgi:hypothetical protein